MHRPPLPFEIADRIAQHYYCNLIQTHNLSSFLELCSVNLQFKRTMYRRWDHLMLAQSLVVNYYSVDFFVENPFQNPYVNRQYCRDNLLESAFRDDDFSESYRQYVAKILWKNRSWFDSKLQSGQFTFGEGEGSFHAKSRGFLSDDGESIRVLGTITDAWNAYDYALISPNRGALLFQRDGEEFAATPMVIQTYPYITTINGNADDEGSPRS